MHHKTSKTSSVALYCDQRDGNTREAWAFCGSILSWTTHSVDGVVVCVLCDAADCKAQQKMERELQMCTHAAGYTRTLCDNKAGVD
eukprot:5876726-Amphidinium_carterae.2